MKNNKPEYLPDYIEIDKKIIDEKIKEITQWLSIATINALNSTVEEKIEINFKNYNKTEEDKNKTIKNSFKDKNPEEYNNVEKESLEKIENFLNNKNNDLLDNKRTSVLFLDFLYNNENLNIWQEILPLLYRYFIENWKLEWWEEKIRKIINPAEWENLFSQLLLHFNTLDIENSQEISRTIDNFIKANPKLELWIGDVWILYNIYNEFKDINSELAKKELKKKLEK